MKFLSLILVSVSMFSCSSSPLRTVNAPVATPTVDTFQISEISYELNSNWGIKATDKIVFHKDGRAKYSARLGFALRGFNTNPDCKGEFQGRIEIGEFESVARLLIQKNFFSLKDKYVAHGVADAETITTAVRYSAGLKTVSNYGGGGDDKVEEIQQAILSRAKQINWQKAAKSTDQ